MKGLDTPVLLEILAGRASAKKLLRSLEGEELCTTEINLFELEAIARDRHGGALQRRLAAVERLRRGLTILPIDEKAVRGAAAKWKDGGQGLAASAWLVYGALESNGCSDWLTSRSTRFPKVPGKLRLNRCVP